VKTSERRTEARTITTTDLGRLDCADALPWLESLEPGSVDLIVADPPYAMGKADWDHFESPEAYVAWTRAWVQAAQRTLKPNGSLYVMGWSELLADVKVAVAPLFAACRWLVWFYRNKANLRDDWGRSHESILHFRNGPKITFNTDPVRIPYNAHTTRYPERTQAETSQYGGERTDKWRPHPDGARPRDVLEIPVLANGTAEKTDHPTQKPVQLIRKFVLASSNPGDLVVDPFSGSGTTAFVCQQLGRRWLACDLDPAWCAVGADRVHRPDAFAGAQTTQSEAATSARRARLRVAGRTRTRKGDQA
jgi:site-specific DNA-methyltransferase (adenine-specific)